MPDLPITYRGIVHLWHCDHVGHMNVMWYVWSRREVLLRWRVRKSGGNRRCK